MAKYKSKTLAVEAYQWNGDYDGKRDPKWITEAMKKPGDEVGAVRMFGNHVMKVVGASGLLNATPRDYLVKLSDSNIIPMKPELFELMFTAV